uniref:Metacaspase-1 (EC) n=1 Tax=Ganoderma boninense TaxID=34458 RepID=A0A5K1K1T4_9APHY|nr:Metacaspase-1 (EC [Ganoderma boninense]
MYRSPYATENLVSFADDDAGALCFSKDFHDTGYSGYIQRQDSCQAFELESYGTLTMSTEDHLRRAKRARLSAARQNPGPAASPAFIPANPVVSKTPQADVNAGEYTEHRTLISATQRLTQRHESHMRDEAFKLAGEAEKVRLAIKCAYCQLAFGRDSVFKELQGMHKQTSITSH